MSHEYKKLPEKKPFSFVELVKEYGDDWRYFVPADLFRVGSEESSLRMHARECWAMGQMERGLKARV